MPDALAEYLASHARALGLNPASLDEAQEADLRDFCEIVLSELAARGLLPSPEQIGCYAGRRAEGN